MGGTLVGLAEGDKGVAVMGQEDVMWDDKWLVEVKGGGDSAATKMEFYTMGGYDV